MSEDIGDVVKGMRQDVNPEVKYRVQVIDHVDKNNNETVAFYTLSSPLAYIADELIGEDNFIANIRKILDGETVRCTVPEYGDITVTLIDLKKTETYNPS